MKEESVFAERSIVDSRGRIGLQLEILSTTDPERGGETCIYLRVKFVEYPEYPEDSGTATLEVTSARFDTKRHPKIWIDFQDWLTRFTVERVMDLIGSRGLSLEHTANIRPELRRGFNYLMFNADQWIEETLKSK